MDMEKLICDCALEDKSDVLLSNKTIICGPWKWMVVGSGSANEPRFSTRLAHLLKQLTGFANSS